MGNNLYKVEKDLRSIAKRYKSVKYSIGLAILFLMLGGSAFSEEINDGNSTTNTIPTREEIATSRENLRNSVGGLQSKIDQAKAENEKGLSGLKLELIQLMEQGDQVVKSPWASWQFGMNYMYNNWRGTYKGRGDKAEKYPFEGIFTRSNDVFERSTSPLSEKYKELPVSTNPYAASTTARAGLGSGYGLASTKKVQEPLVAINVDASIRPKDVQRDPVPAPTVAVQAPNFNPISPKSLLPPSVEVPKPKDVEVPNKTPEVKAKPVSSYKFDQRSILVGGSVYNEDIDGMNGVYWSGWNPETKTDEFSKSKFQRDAAGVVQVEPQRITNVFYLNTGDRPRPGAPESKWTFHDVKEVHVKGKEGLVPIGTIALHTVWDGTIKNVNGYLHGYGSFISSETWHSGKVKLENVKVDVTGEYNSVFYGYPSSYFSLGIDNYDYHSYLQRGKYDGDLDVTINNAKNNYIYTIMGVQGAFKIKSTGKYVIKGDNNIVYLGLGYSPNWHNLKGSGDVINDNKTEMTPSIQLGQKHPIMIDGNSNVALFFENKYGTRETPHYDWGRGNVGDPDRWAKSTIGIYQGEIDVSANIGEQSSSIANVGVYSRSGQREGIVPSKDLGSPTEQMRKDATDPWDNNKSYQNKHPQYDIDKIHNLEIAAAKIYFGKHSLNGVMFAADRGTVIDVARPDKADKNLGRTAYKEVTRSSEIKDSVGELKSSFDNNVNQAATGTVIAYATGTWDNKDMPGGVAGGLKGKGSEINIYVPITMSGRAILDGGKLNPSVALVGDNKGIINAKSSVTAKGYASIVALAQKEGQVTVEGDIKAKDEWAAKDEATKPYLYSNIGAYAGTKGKVVVNGNVDIHGTAAMASGAGSVVELKGNQNKVQTGKNGALAATNGGIVHFGGGNIIHKNNQVGDHASTTPFYADNTSKIDFTGATTIEIADGILMPGTTAADYTGASGTATKYNGMQNVKIKLIGDNVVLKSTSGEDTVWTGASGVVTDIKTQMKLNDFDLNGKKYKIYYINGTFKIDTDINLSNPSIAFHNVGLSREKVTINFGKTVSSTTGAGLAIASSDGAIDNMQSGYTNKGKVSITGGTANSIALNVSYGHVINDNVINIDNGIGAYGINGSKLVNNGNINVTTQGIGMAGFASPKKLVDFNQTKGYGTDKKIDDGSLVITDKVLEIENNKTITVNGNKSIGLYGETNDVKNTALIKADNGHITNKGKLILTGDESYGIVSKGAGNKITLNGTGSSDIITGKSGIGVYAEGKSVIDFTSPNYGFEIKEKGTGIFIKNGSTINPGNMELKYTGSNTGTGVALFYEGGAILPNMTNNVKVNLVDTVGTTGGLVGLYTKGTGTLANNAEISGKSGYGIITEGTTIENNSLIKFNSPITNKKATVGIYTKASDKITNGVAGKILLGKDSVGIYGHEVENSGEITVGDSGTGIYSIGGSVNLRAGSKINVAKAKAAAVYTKGNGQTIKADAGSDLSIGDTSFGFINEGTGNTIHSNIANQNLGNDTVYIYSKDSTGHIFNNTNLKSMTGLPNYGVHPGGSLNYGIYSAGTVENNADIDFSSGEGNVGIYSIDGGTAINKAGKTITVGKSYIHETDVDKNRYSLAMAAGFTPSPDDKGRAAYTGKITNEGILKVNGEYSIGMYGTEAGTVVKNVAGAKIQLNASNTTGMYLDNGALGINDGIIETTSPGLKKVVGVVVKNGAKIRNNGTIKIHADSSVGILSKGNAAGANPGIIENYGTFSIIGSGSKETQTPEGTGPLEKSLGGISIKTPKNSSIATIEVDGKIVTPEKIDTKGLKEEKMLLSTIGMYINTSGVKFTNPIIGLSALKHLKKADLIIGTEATEYTNSKYIQIGKKILDPYNKTIKDNPQIEKWSIYSGSLTWMANIAQNQSDGTIANAYLAKIPYTEWAGKQSTPVDKKDTYNFLDGLEQRYGVEAIGTRENQLFQKLNGIGKNEEILLYQAIDEMMGHQYANVQQRVNATGVILDKEFDYLRDEWRTASKDSNKVKTFGTRGEYKTDTAGVIDYTNNAYGVAYVHENEDIKLGRGIGWYTGIVHNTFKFKDIGKSKEKQLQAKVGIFKSVPFDHNNSLNWTISGELSVGYNKMHRKFLVVDEIFNAKSKYYTYGIGIKNEIGKEFRLNEDFSLRPYAALKLEYGRVGKIKEKSGEVKLEVKHNDYISVKPEIGAELAYKHYFGRKALKTTLGVAYENELGRVANGKNKARVVDTTADWFNIRGEKEDRKGNVKFDLNVGLDNQRYGVTANVGYDTKGENLRGGLGLRVIF